MIFIGGVVYAPIATYWLIYLNPWYLTKAIPYFWKSFPKKNKYIKILTAVAVDKLIIT